MYIKSKLGIKLFDNGVFIIDNEYFHVNSIFHIFTTDKYRIINHKNYGIQLHINPKK
jgi:hypothetical protein